MRSSLVVCIPLALACAAGATAAQQVRTLVEIGDDIFGVGSVTGVENFTISDSGDWFVTVKYRNGINDEFVLLRNGIPTLQWGDSLASPPGASVETIDLPSADRGDDFAVILTFDGYPASKDTGCFFNSHVLAQEGVPSQAPEFGPGTTWSSFSHVRLNEQRLILCQGKVEDPTISGSGDAALVLIDVGEGGELVSEHVLLKEGTAYGGLPSIQALGTKTHTLAFNNRGDFLTFVDTSGSSSTDGNILLNFTSVAREGSASPVPGRNWSTLASPRLDLNDFGDYVHTGTLAGDRSTNQLLVKNGEKFVQKGDIITGVAPYSISNMATAPVFITNGGKVVWFGQFSHPDSSRNKAIFLNHEMLLQAGVTKVGLHTLKLLRTVTESFFLPPDGRYLVFWGKLTDGTIGIYLLDLGTVVPMEGCYGNVGTLVNSDGLPLLGRRLEFEMDEGQAAGVTPVFLLSTLPVTGWPPCGLDAGSVGELLVDVSAGGGNPVYFEMGNPWGGIPTRFQLDIPSEPLLAGAELYAQGLFWDVGDQLPVQNLLLTNGLRIVLAAP